MRASPSAAALVLGLCTAIAAATDSGEADAVGAAERLSERGPVSARVRVEPDTVRIGDPVTLTLEVTAEAGIELLMPAFGAALERYAILDFAPRERIDESGNTIATQRYRLQAPSSGQHSIPPITVEFVDRRPGQRAAPEDEDAFELLTERFEFTVESVVPKGAGQELKPPLGPLAHHAAEQGRAWPWIAAGLGILAVGAALILVVRHLRGRARSESAHQLALRRLQALENRPRPDAAAMDAFFVELSDVVRRYLEDRFLLHAPELTTEEFLDVAASSPDLTREHRSFLQTFLSQADQVKFARLVPNATEVESALATARRFVQQTAVGETRTASAANTDHRRTASA